MLSRNAFDRTSGEVISSRTARSELEGYFSGDGNLSLKWYSTDVPGKNIGREMISTAIETLGPERVTSVSARLGRTNLDVYENSLRNGLSATDAVWRTPLGKSMQYLGYRNLEVQNYSSVIFRR